MEGIRDRLERLVQSTDPDTHALAEALLGVLAIYEAQPYKNIPAHWLYAVLTRHLIKDNDVIYPAHPQHPRPAQDL